MPESENLSKVSTEDDFLPHGFTTIVQLIADQEARIKANGPEAQSRGLSCKSQC
jgi:hypothetical protein